MVRHEIENFFLAQLGRAEIGERIVVTGRLRQASQERCLGQRQVLYWLAEVGSGRGCHAVGQVPEVDLVQVPLEYLLFAVVAGQLDGQHGFLQLAIQCLAGSLVGVE